MKPQTYYDLLEALPNKGCPVCQILQITTERFITYLLADRVLDGSTHRGLAARRGLCNQHINELNQRRGIVLPLAIFYKAAMDEIVQVIKTPPSPVAAQRGFGNLLSKASSCGAAWADQLEPTAPCVICADMMRQEARLAATLCDYLTRSPMKEAYEASGGLCLPHLIHALRAAGNPETVELLIRTQCRLWEQGAEELGEFIAKLDYARRTEPKGHEGGSLNRAIAWMGGLAGVFGLDSRRD